MAFSVFVFAGGGYAVVLLAAMLVLESRRGPVPQQGRLPLRGEDTRLQAWPRTRRDCAAGHERALPLRLARQPVPARRRRSCPR